MEKEKAKIEYEKLIEFAMQHPLNPRLYKEKHHIIPKSMGGNNVAENLVYLDLPEHIKAHELLMWLSFGEEGHAAMCQAYFLMINTHYFTDNVDLEGLEYVRKKAVEISSERMKGRKVSEETKRKISETLKGHKVTKYTREKISESKKGKGTGKNNPFYGEKHTDLSLRKMSEASTGRKHSNKTKKLISENNAKFNLGKKLSEETRKKISESKKGSIPWMKGRKHTAESKRKNSESQKLLATAAKSWIMKFNGKICLFKNLGKWSEKNGYNRECLSNINSCGQKYHKDITMCFRTDNPLILKDINDLNVDYE